MTEIKSFKYEVASKKVRSPDMMKTWQESESYQEYLGFIIAIGDSIKGHKIRETVTVSDNCGRVVKILDTLTQLVQDTPPVEMQARYGNPAYRDWFHKMETGAESMVSEMLPPHMQEAVLELTPYLVDSFGNSTRIDYGTGHEMTFVMFVCGLFKVGFLGDEDRLSVGLKVFSAYFDLARLVQKTYRMEPAGSMGVWNLDDYQFVSFILGAGQLTQGARLKPKAICEPEMAEMMKLDYHLFACLAYIHEVKTGPFHEHSNQLWNISAVPTWDKVYSGLIKMYKAEVLTKFPVLQHTLFGSIFSLTKASNITHLPEVGKQLNMPSHPGITTRVPTGPPEMGTRFPGGPPEMGTRFPGGPPEMGTRFPGGPSEIGTRFSGGPPEMGTRFPGGPPETVTRFPSGPPSVPTRLPRGPES